MSTRRPRTLVAVRTSIVTLVVGGLLALGVSAPAFATSTFTLTVKLTNSKGVALTGYDVFPVEVANGQEPFNRDEYADPATPVTGKPGFYSMTDLDATVDHTLLLAPSGAAANDGSIQFLGGSATIAGAKTFSATSASMFMGVTVATGGTITGKLMSPTGAPLNNATVQIYEYDGTQWKENNFVTTASNGTWNFTNAPPGSYKFEYFSPTGQYSTIWSGGAADEADASAVFVNAGSKVAVSQKFVAGTGSIAGSIDFIVNGDYYYPDHWTPLAIPVTDSTLQSPSSIDRAHEIWGATTGKSGAWAVSGLTPGQYIIEFLPYYWNQSDLYLNDSLGADDVVGAQDFYQATVYTVTAGHKTVAGYHAQLNGSDDSYTDDEGAGISITVDDQSTSHAVPGAEVEVSRDSDGYSYLTGTSSADGSTVLTYGDGSGVSVDGTNRQDSYTLYPGSYTIQVIDPTGQHEPVVTTQDLVFGANPVQIQLPALTNAPGFSSQPTIAQTATAVGTTYAVSGALSNRPDGVITYQWLRDDQPIYGATTASYTSVAGDYLKHLSVRTRVSSFGFADQFTAADVGNDTTSVESIAAAPNSTTVPSILVPAAVHVGTVLQADPGKWDVSGLHFSYQWTDDGVAVGEPTTAGMHTVTQAEFAAGSAIGVEVTPSETGYSPVNSATASSNTVTATAVAAITVKKSPVVTKSVKGANETFKVTSGSWSVAGVSYGYTWTTAGDDTFTASGASLTVPVGSTYAGALGVTVDATKDGYTHGETHVLAVKGTTPFASTTAPSVSDGGTAVTDPTQSVQVGDVLTVTHATWADAAQPGLAPTTVTDQWMRQVGSAAPVAIKGATKPTYVVAATDIRATLSVVETAGSSSQASGTAVADAGTGLISSALQIPVRTVSLTGIPSGGHVLTGAVNWAPVTGVSTTYQWFYCPDSTCTDRSDHSDYIAVSKATKNALAVASGDERVFLRVTGVKGGYTTASVDSDDVDVSDPVSIVTKVPVEIKGAIAGVATIGVKLAATAGVYSNAKPTRTYQWEVSDGGNWVPATGAGNTTASYTPNGADFTSSGDKLLRVVENVAVAASSQSGSSVSTPVTLRAGRIVVTKKPAIVTSTSSFTVTTGVFAPATGTQAVTWTMDGSPAAPGASFLRSSATTGHSIVATVNYSGVDGYADYSEIVVAQVGTDPVLLAGAHPIAGSAFAAPLTAPAWDAVFGYTDPTVVPVLAYQWYLGTAAIRNATSASYSAPSSDVGKKLAVREVATAFGYTTRSYLSPLVALQPASFGGPSLPTLGFTGALAAGTVVSAVSDTGDYVGGTPSFSYVWQHAAAATFTTIAGATKPSYTVGATDANDQLRVIVTASKAGYATLTLDSVPQTVALVETLDALVPPVISGPGTVGSPLTVSSGTWNSTSLAFSYQWVQDGVAIPGATGATFIPTAVGAPDSELAAEVTATRPGFAPVTVSSNAVVLAPGAAPVATVAPVVTKVVVSGITSYSVSPGTWNLDGLTYTYQWQIAGVDGIGGGATTSTYIPDPSEHGVLSVQTTVTRPGYTPTPVTTSTYAFAI